MKKRRRAARAKTKTLTTPTEHRLSTEAKPSTSSPFSLPAGFTLPADWKPFVPPPPCQPVEEDAPPPSRQAAPSPVAEPATQHVAQPPVFELYLSFSSRMRSALHWFFTLGQRDRVQSLEMAHAHAQTASQLADKSLMSFGVEAGVTAHALVTQKLDIDTFMTRVEEEGVEKLEERLALLERYEARLLGKAQHLGVRIPNRTISYLKQQQHTLALLIELYLLKKAGGAPEAPTLKQRLHAFCRGRPTPRRVALFIEDEMRTAYLEHVAVISNPQRILDIDALIKVPALAIRHPRTVEMQGVLQQNRRFRAQAVQFIALRDQMFKKAIVAKAPALGNAADAAAALHTQRSVSGWIHAHAARQRLVLQVDPQAALPLNGRLAVRLPEERLEQHLQQMVRALGITPKTVGAARLAWVIIQEWRRTEEFALELLGQQAGVNKNDLRWNNVMAHRADNAVVVVEAVNRVLGASVARVVRDLMHSEHNTRVMLERQVSTARRLKALGLDARHVDLTFETVRSPRQRAQYLLHMVRGLDATERREAIRSNENSICGHRKRMAAFYGERSGLETAPRHLINHYRNTFSTQWFRKMRGSLAYRTDLAITNRLFADLAAQALEEEYDSYIAAAYLASLGSSHAKNPADHLEQFEAAVLRLDRETDWSKNFFKKKLAQALLASKKPVHLWFAIAHRVVGYPDVYQSVMELNSHKQIAYLLGHRNPRIKGLHANIVRDANQAKLSARTRCPLVNRLHHLAKGMPRAPGAGIAAGLIEYAGDVVAKAKADRANPFAVNTALLQLDDQWIHAVVGAVRPSSQERARALRLAKPALRHARQQLQALRQSLHVSEGKAGKHTRALDELFDTEKRFSNPIFHMASMRAQLERMTMHAATVKRARLNSEELHRCLDTIEEVSRKVQPLETRVHSASEQQGEARLIALLKALARPEAVHYFEGLTSFVQLYHSMNASGTNKILGKLFQSEDLTQLVNVEKKAVTELGKRQTLTKWIGDPTDLTVTGVQRLPRWPMTLGEMHKQMADGHPAKAAVGQMVEFAKAVAQRANELQDLVAAAK